MAHHYKVGMKVKLIAAKVETIMVIDNLKVWNRNSEKWEKDRVWCVWQDELGMPQRENYDVSALEILR